MGATGLATTPAEYRDRLLEQPDQQLDAWAAEAMRDISIRRGVLAVLHDVQAASVHCLVKGFRAIVPGARDKLVDYLVENFEELVYV